MSFMAMPSYTNKYSVGDNKTGISYQNQYKKQQQYRNHAISTMTQGEMLVKLYEEIIKQLNLAIFHIDEEYDVAKRNASLQKAQKILNHLRMILNFEYEISDSLHALYEFFLKCIVEANIKSDSKPLKDILPLIEDLNQAYIEAEKSLKTTKK